MLKRINFNRPFEGRIDEELRVRRAAMLIIASGAEMGIIVRDVSEGSNLKILHDGLLDYASFLELACGHIRKLMEDTETIH